MRVTTTTEDYGGHTSECEASCHPSCPIGQERRREAERGVARIEHRRTHGLTCSVCGGVVRTAQGGKYPVHAWYLPDGIEPHAVVLDDGRGVPC